ncbi:disease resistance protein [Tanacetum coccineum]
MTYTGLELFMENLKQLIYSNDNPLSNNHPSILSERPQLQLLYEELDSMIQILFDCEHTELHELKSVKDLKRRLKNTAEEAQDIIDLFVSGVHFRKKGYSPRSDVFKTFLNLDHKASKRNLQRLLESSNRSTLGSEKLFDEIVVGLDHHVEVIRDKLVEDQKQLDVVSIVGMGGLGKTTLATKVFNDRFIMYHFDIRAWVTVSQTYKRRDVLIQILASLGVQVDIKNTDFKLREMLHKSLKGQRYLIVIDDIWSKEAWDNLKVLFPDDDTSSRILLTSRLNEVGLHAKSKPSGLVHFLSYLTKKQSWELLCKKVFHGEECPEWLIKHGMQIANKCQGPPLSVVVIAGLLAKEPINRDLWKKIAHSVGSYIATDKNGHMETLDLSYNHLPLHLRDCFLYLGGFPEDFKFPARWLIWLWMAEGFIQEAENQSFEDIGEAYLLDLVGRNLVIVAERKSNGGVKSFKVHDLVRELSLRIAQEERFFLKINSTESYPFIISYKQHRMFTYQNIPILNFGHPPTPSLRTLFCFLMPKSWIYDIAEHFRSFALLRVLDLRNCKLIHLPEGIVLLVHLRCHLPWSDMSIIQSLPNLEVVKLNDTLKGALWKTGEAQFRQLKFLRLENLYIKQWEAYSINFPSLKQLEIVKCRYLEEVPLEIGDIPTLELIKIDGCRVSVVKSMKRIQEEQHDVGNYDLQIKVNGMELSFLLSNKYKWLPVNRYR